MGRRILGALLIFTLALTTFTEALGAKSLSLPNWNVYYPKLDSSVVKLAIDKKVVHSGNGSLNVKYSGGWVSNNYLQIYPQGDSIELGEEYVVSFWSKADSGTAKFMWNWSEIGRISGASDWTYHEIVFKPTMNSMLLNIIIESTACIWFDDISMCKTGDDKNVLYNGGLESCDYTPPGDVTNVNAVGGDSKVSLTWENPTNSDFFGVSVYEIDSETAEETFLGEAGEDMTSFVAENLSNNVIHSFLLKSVDDYGNESDGVFVFGQTATDDYYTKGLVKDYDQEAKTLTVSASITNNTHQEGLSCELIVAIFDENGGFVGVNGEKKTVNINQEEPFTVTLQNVSELYTSEVYLWDSIDGACPLGDAL